MKNEEVRMKNEEPPCRVFAALTCRGAAGFFILHFSFFIFFMAGSAKADGGNVLDRIIRLAGMKGTVYALLGKVSELSGYLFIYDSKVINNDSIVRVRKQECSVRQAIHKITGNRHLELKVLGNHILITRAAERELVKETELLPSRPVYSTIAGVLLDKETGEPIVCASVIAQGTSLGNITNQNGEFRLNLPDSLRHCKLSFSHLGYVGQMVEASALEGRSNVLSLEPKVISLQEVLIRLVEPKRLLREMIEHRDKNYSASPVYLTTFYREGIQLKNKFQSLTEAVFKVYKSPAMEPELKDQVKLLKMSKIDNREQTDSVFAKISSGVEACLLLDIMKNLPDFLSLESNEELYTYTSGDIVSVDDRIANVVYFEQRHGVREPLFCGELYIDSENSALLRARFEIHPRYVKAATRLFVIRQAPKIRLTTDKIVYTISYRPWHGTYYVHHIRGDLYFKMKRKRLLFSNPTLYTWFEMVTCRIDEKNVTRFPRAERLPVHTVFAETYFKYDANFWGDSNVIPLEEELGKIIEKVALKIEQTEAP